MAIVDDPRAIPHAQPTSFLHSSFKKYYENVSMFYKLT